MQVSPAETVVGESLAMTSTVISDQLVLYVLSRDSKKKWRITVVDAVTKTRKKLILIEEIIQVENNDIEMMVTADKKYIVLKV